MIAATFTVSLLSYLPGITTPPLSSRQCPISTANPSFLRSSQPPRMQVASLLDTLRRRGEVTEEVIDTAFFSSTTNEDRVTAYTARVARINALEDDIELLSDEELAAKTSDFRARLTAGATEDELLEEAFAVVREAAWRTLELRHYDVQLVGGMALNDGFLAQMGTGEGKTLVATCAVYLNALSGKGAMLVTANDYLARRDAETMGQVYSFLGLSVGLVQANTPTPQRREAYNSDVTYVTNSELGFDYLRDHLAMSPSETVLRDSLNFCVVDEGDSVLIDEARVPLIISGRTTAPVEKYETCAKLANALEPITHYEIFEKEQTIGLTEAGTKYAETALQVEDLFDPMSPWASYVSNAVKAKELFKKDKAYIVKDGEALIVDEFSGRVMDGRRWGDGLHQSIEAKESLEVQPETETIASITYQSLFRRFNKLSSMSGTALTEAEEMATIYDLDVVAVPPVLPAQRVDLPNSVHKNVKGKSNAALNELVGMHKAGRPVLVGTTSVEASQAFSDKLKSLDVFHEVLNAKPEAMQREAEIISQAGRKGMVTIATNMAGRGTDILLGGSAGAMAKLKVREALAKAAGIALPPIRDGFYPCAIGEEATGWLNDAAAQYASEAGAMMAKAAAEGKELDDRDRLLSLDELLAVAASSADVTEGSATDLSREAYESIKEAFEEVLAPEREEVQLLGGLHVIGTNLHDSRRIDDQLRGRAGRQGDPGSTHFFLSLEDRVFRIFGGDKVKGVLDFLRVADDQPLESEQVTKVVKDTQGKVERYYYELRKGLFDFDEVLAAQREDTYRKRDAVLRSNPKEAMAELEVLCTEVVDDIFNANWKAEGAAANAPPPEAADDALATKLIGKLQTFFGAIDLSADALTGVNRAAATAAANAAVSKALDAKVASLDGVREGLAFESMRYLRLLQADNLWKGHMKAMNFVKDFAGLKVYNQQDPLDVYREEGLGLYEKMQAGLRQNSVFSFFAYDPRAQAAAK